MKRFFFVITSIAVALALGVPCGASARSGGAASGAGDDTTPPVLLSSEPAGGAALAAPPAGIVLHFSEPLATSPAPSAALGGGPPVSAAVEGSDVLVTPLGAFLPHSVCTLTVSGVADPAGNAAATVVVTFTVERVPLAFSFAASRAVIRYRGVIVLRGRVPLPGAMLVVERRVAAAADFSPRSQIAAAADGTYSLRVYPWAATTYRLTTPETADYLATQALVSVRVRPRLVLDTPRDVWKGQAIVFHGRVGPAHAGAAVTIQRKYADQWRDWRQVTLNSRSRFTLRWKPGEVRVYRFRLHMAADDVHLEATSAVRDTRVSPPNPHHISRAYKHFIVVDLSECHLYYYERGRLLRRFDCVVGKPSTPTPIGQWPVYQKVVGMWGPYGPFTMWYHSPYHFGIHGTNEPWLLSRFPRYYSHGCTRLANRNITWLFPRVPVGTPVRNIR